MAGRASNRLTPEVPSRKNAQRTPGIADARGPKSRFLHGRPTDRARPPHGPSTPAPTTAATGRFLASGPVQELNHYYNTIEE